MKNNDQFSLTLRVMIGTAAFGLSIYFIHAAAEFIIPILLAGIIVLSASPLLKWLLSKKTPQWLVFMVIFSVFFWSAILGPIGSILGVPLTMAVKELVLEVDPRNRWVAHFMSKEVQNFSEESEA